MKLLATSLLLLAGLVVASVALATDFTRKGNVSGLPLPAFKVAAVLQCDDGNATSGFITYDTDRFGNSFNFGVSSRLSTVLFVQFGFGTPGPYNYDIELYDPVSCTNIGGMNNLVAADAANAPQIELVDFCAQNVMLAGDVLVMIDSNTCPASPLDCYPVLVNDDEVGQTCPWYIDNGTCYNILTGFGASYAAPFILRVDTNNCPTPVKPGSWGSVKQHYR